jgi:hypothetical protein
LSPLLGPVVAGLIVVAGWLVVERFARRREHRTDLRSAVASLSLAIEEVRDAAIVFYQLPGNDPQSLSLAATIRAKIASLSDQLDILKGASLSIDSDELLKRFRQSVTGGDFDSLIRQPLTPTSPTFVRMAADAQALNRTVQMAMFKLLLK